MTETPTGPDIFDYDNPEWARQFILQLRYNCSSDQRAHMARITRGFLNGHLGFEAPPGDADAAADALALTRDGYCRLGSLLSESQAAAAREYLSISDEIDADTNVAPVETSRLVGAPELMEAVMSPRVLHRVARYLGVPPTVQTLIAWWSPHGREQARDAQLFHYDFHDFKWLKLFVYLTDVDAEAGPHVMMKGTHDPALLPRRMSELERRDPEMAKREREAFATQARLSDPRVERMFGVENKVSLEGKAGEAFLVDTAAYHKGELPRTQDRLVFQALYTMLPTIKDQVRPVDLPGAHGRYAAHAGIKAVDPAFWRYAMRLVIRDRELDTA